MELQEEVIFDKNDAMKGTVLYAFIEGERLQMKMHTYVGTNLPGCAKCRRIYFYQYGRRTFNRRHCKGGVTGAYEYDLIATIVK